MARDRHSFIARGVGIVNELNALRRRTTTRKHAAAPNFDTAWEMTAQRGATAAQNGLHCALACKGRMRPDHGSSPNMETVYP